MKTRLPFVVCLLLSSMVSLPALSQTDTGDRTVPANTKNRHVKKGRSAGGDIASGSGNVAAGAAKGVGHAAAGVGKGAGDLVTLHPVGAAADVGKGGLYAGKSVAVGTTKGSAKIVKGIGKGIKHLF